MRDVTVSRFVPRSPPTVARMLTPEAMVEYEGSFEVRNARERDGDTLVTVGGGGVEFVLRFEETDDGLRYEQAGEAGPFDAMETVVAVEPAEGGSTVTARSSVSLGLPAPALTDRVAAWKRRGELERALDALAADC
ncbi:SRPBCC family protein [Halopelagius longus]|uniref:Polyketide cyclase / dehydrase and lipid transport n=1 Tax=Halopelagius longus TaxID=1236180 RepID=A0A1H1EU96_9EURY|nr:SRPBCC family protein [Halopelagius longus]SDQ92301.1 Polyketide cyclase / dehydrase and lipid transport [Halopelagius longus]